MAVTPGSHLGPYEIVSALGAGGMGEVYRARDTKLGRDVAIKVLPDLFANDPERLARFQREAQVLASLNHPNIAHIHGLEESGGVRALVMELVEGDDLAQRIARGAIPLDEALPIAKQVAEALEAAHEQGIIHRDLKPANIKVRADGTVKVLDFGLAKAMDPVGSAPNVTPSPAITTPAMTQAGVVLGTAAYMSPEQAKGRAVDKRCDVWAFGCVLYEMLTGSRAFEGDDVSDTLAAVLRGEPQWTALPAGTPDGMRFLLRRCLDKDLNRRLHAAADVSIVIDELKTAWPTRAPVPSARARGPHALALAGIFILGLIAAGGAAWMFRPVPAPAPAPRLVSRTVIPLPPNEQLAGGTGPMVALSPDGTHLAYVAMGAGGAEQIYLRAMDSSEARAISGSERARAPFFSPDGQWLGFLTDDKLKKIAVSGGAATILQLASPIPVGAAWGPNDTLVFGQNIQSTLGVSVAGRPPHPLTTLQAGEVGHRWPQFLPGGTTVLFTIWKGGTPDNSNIAVARLDTGASTILIRGGTFGRYVSTGHLVFYRGGTMLAVGFDPVRLELIGTPVSVLEGIMSTTGNSGAAQFSVSDQGSLVYVPGSAQSLEPLSLVWVDRKGVTQLLPAPLHAYATPRLSPDGRQLAVTLTDSDRQDVWIYEIARDTLTRLTFDGTNNYLPLWTPDGQQVIFRSQRGALMGLFAKPADGSGPEQQLSIGEYRQTAQVVSPDGRTLVYSEPNAQSDYDLWTLSLDGNHKAQPFLQTPSDDRTARLSPDGHWLAYASNASGRYEVYVQPFPGPGATHQISADGGAEIVWGARGELFYRSGANRERMMAVDVQTQPTFSAGKPHMLFEGPYASGAANGWGANYDVTADGQRFLMFAPKEQPQTPALTQINVVQNWTGELKRLVPTQ